MQDNARAAQLGTSADGTWDNVFPIAHKSARGAAPLDGFAIMAKSAANPRAAAISRAQIARHHFKTLESALSGPHTNERAAILLSLVAGLQLMRQTLRLPALAKAAPPRSPPRCSTNS